LQSSWMRWPKADTGLLSFMDSLDSLLLSFRNMLCVCIQLPLGSLSEVGSFLILVERVTIRRRLVCVRLFE